ncbi:MAG: hypothetical protein ACYDHU_09080 [Acidimicrobiales bacterium]
MSFRCARGTGSMALALFGVLAVVAWYAGGGPGVGGTDAGASVRTAPVPGTPAATGTGARTKARTTATSAAAQLSLVSQSPWVEPNSPGAPQVFTLELDIGARSSSTAGSTSGDAVSVTVYDHLVTRTAFDQTLSGQPTGVLGRTPPVSVAALARPPRGTPGEADLKIAIQPTSTATPAPSPGTPVLDLHCLPDTGECPGVYPVVVALTNPTGAVIGRFTTYLTYAEATSPDPLHFAWVAPIAAPVTIRSGSPTPAKAVAPMTASTAGSLSQFVASLHAYPGVPVTLAAAPETLQALRDSGAAGRLAVSELGAMSADPAVRQFLAQPYVPVALGALAGAGEPTEIAAQMTRGSTVLQHLGIQVSPATSVPTTASASTATPGTGPIWVATGQIGSALGTGLAQIGATRVVVPDGSLAPPVQAATSGTWTTTFNLSLGKSTVVAAASDDLLAAHFAAQTQDPALAANQLLADLAMIHFEAPNTPQARGVVAVPPSSWQPNAAFDDALLAGLQGNPNVQATTLTSFFAQVPGPGATLPDRHQQQAGSGPVLSSTLARQFSRERLRLSAFDASVAGGTTVLTLLDNLLLSSESSSLRPAQQAAGVKAFARVLTGQLGLISFGTERTITLTARTGAIPVTVLSAAPYTVTGTLTLTSDRFTFPQGTSQRLVIDHPTTPVRVQVVARTSGDLPMAVTFDSPTGRLQFASGDLTVRSTATSVVGVVLTVAALLVLLGWWVRTWRSGRRRRALATGDPSER